MESMPMCLSKRASPCGKCDLEISSTMQPSYPGYTQSQYAPHINCPPRFKPSPCKKQLHQSSDYLN